MDEHFRDTVFGQVVRLLSRNTLLRFPDELDPTLWKQCVEHDSSTASSTSGMHDELPGSINHTVADLSNGGEKGLEQGTGLTSAHGSGDGQIFHDGKPSHEKTTAVRLVDWYGPDDQEVWLPFVASSVLLMLTHAEESPELVNGPQAVDNLPDMPPELWDIHRQLHLHAR